LRGCGLAVESSDAASSSGGPSGCEWYFFDRAVYAAVRGLYDPPGEPGDPEGPAGGESEAEASRGTLVDLLGSGGRRVPLQGVVLALPARLLDPSGEKALRQYGLQTWSLLNRLSAELDFSPPVYVLLTFLDEDRGWAQALDLLERDGQPLGALSPAGKPESGEKAAARAAEAFESGVLGLLEEVVDEAPWVAGPCLTVFGEAEALRKPLSIFCSALSNPSPLTPSHRIQGIFAARMPWNGNGARGAHGPRGGTRGHAGRPGTVGGGPGDPREVSPAASVDGSGSRAAGPASGRTGRTGIPGIPGAPGTPA
jgi:hypothetical protein